LQVAAELRDDPEVPAATRLAAAAFIYERAWGKPKDVAPDVSTGIPALRIEFVQANGSNDQHTINSDSNPRIIEAIEFNPTLEREE